MKKTNLNIYKSNNLSSLDFINHAFFGRNGGRSTGDYSSLNVSYFTKDNPENITHNRNIITSYLDSNYQLITLNQQSKNTVVVINSNSKPSYHHKGDALITQNKGLILGVYTADCVPILLADPITKTIAAIHAGHNGAFLGIVEKTITKLVGMNVNPNNLYAALGPSIKQESYETQEDFYLKFLIQNTHNNHYFNYNKHKKKYFFSLQSYIINKLKNLGIKNIEELPFNTFTNPKTFFSHRYSTQKQKDRGLQISTIVIKE